jgi:hypothetical protein
LVNQSSGIINANVASAPLEIDNFVINGGVLEASNGAELLLKTGRLRGSGGVIEALSGSEVVIQGTAIDGGTLVTSGTGVISATAALINGSGAHGVVNSGALRVGSGGGLTAAGVFTNSGSISVDPTLHTPNLQMLGRFNNGGTVTLRGAIPRHHLGL